MRTQQNRPLVFLDSNGILHQTYSGCYVSRPNGTFAYWRNVAKPGSVRTNAGWVAYQYNGERLIAKAIDLEANALTISEAIAQ